MDKERQEILEWFVQFGNMDLDQIKPGDKAKLLIESEEYLSPKKDLDQFTYRPMDPKLFALTIDPKTFTEEFMGKMAWAFEIPERDTPEYWNTVKALQGVAKGILWQFAELHPKPDKGIHVAQGGGMMWRGEMMIQMHWEKTFHLAYIPLTESHSRYIELKFYRLMDGLLRSTIQRCPGCEKYFLNPTKRKKSFCSPRCMWRVNAEKRREELKEKHPQKYKAYLKKQREIMNQKYEKEQKAKGYKKVTHYKRKED